MAEFHPLANVFPLMEGVDFDELVESIKASGQLEPIIMFEGKILDGRNRARACKSAGVTPVASVEDFRERTRRPEISLSTQTFGGDTWTQVSER